MHVDSTVNMQQIFTFEGLIFLAVNVCFFLI